MDLLLEVEKETQTITVEIFPKQAITSGIGNLIRTPMTVPDVRKGRCAFLKPGDWFETFDENEQLHRKE